MVGGVHRTWRHRNDCACRHFAGLRFATSYESGKRSRKHNIFTHFPKDRNCEICQRTKITRALCRRRNGGAVPRAANFGDVITADQKVLKSESRNNQRCVVVVHDLATQWIQCYPSKTKLRRKRKRVRKSSSNRQKSQRSFTLTILWNLQNLVKTYLGIIGRQHLIDPRPTELPKEQYEEW